ncbi:glycosyltransferase family 4 protein [Pontivivens ytuae]|uniref:Glycosyltransferase family 4 protein n=1 Tax=Pontivivens ytuae TaxID=2789856 RepID=A0A7S9LPM2_9RHOB|nr:glycosyltransferase family 4 protein [Pontivivens ytuae]QPH52781.1 glycosyltransferase family 4 protein [Pontivivens ytuae]
MSLGDFAIPGDLEMRTGGYAYDRHVLAALPGLRHVALPGSFPAPTDADLEETRALLSGHGPVMIDGLALGATPVALLEGLERPIVALCHHPLALETGLDAVQAEALRASETAALGVVEAVICTSTTTARILATEYGVDDARITVAEPGLAQMDAAARQGEPPVILTVGSFTPRKGHDVLIEALLRLEDLPWQARWIGARPDEEWAARIEARVAEVGLTDRIAIEGAATDMAAVYAGADLFCLPSHYEGYGMVFAEAMMAGLPIIACAGGAVPDVVPATAGRLTEPGDARALADSLRMVLDDGRVAERMATAGRAHALSLPTWAETAARIADVLEGVRA